MSSHPMTYASVGSVTRALVRFPGRVLLVLIRGYQLLISPMRPQTCRYYPSCSQYAVIAITRHGAIRGTGLAAWRLLRCNPWSAGGVDDVPPAHDRQHHHHHVAPATS
ncbi:membrane protein insertion efficiency factor YidD [Cellulomonas sp.]|uniref:membrane protein insertion efficiency factor YidD n=1 Tax=Cellulomonas sp. TaxID=40001 RepID=UPI00344F127E